jgi:uncharacterized membrane protein YsdA (DUF1294 family)
MYHYVKIHMPLSDLLPIVRFLDWSLVVTGCVYLLYFIHKSTHYRLRIPLFILLVLSLLFFWYGFLFASYETFHPWFHVIGQGTIGLIVLLL